MKRFDVNACFGHWQYWDLYQKTPEDLIAQMDQNAIERAAVLSLRGVFMDWRAGNDETLSVAARYPKRLIPMATISPFLGGNGNELRRVLDAGARGVRMFPSFHSYRLDSEFLDDICTVAAERSVPVMIPTRPMMNWRFTPIAIDALGAVFERHPKTTFILSGPNYLIEYQAAVRVMKRCLNVLFDICCLQGFNAVGKLVADVGAARILFGTGALLNYPACNVAKLDNAEISDGDRQTIAGENASQLFA